VAADYLAKLVYLKRQGIDVNAIDAHAKAGLGIGELGAGVSAKVFSQGKEELDRIRTELYNDIRHWQKATSMGVVSRDRAITNAMSDVLVDIKSYEALETSDKQYGIARGKEIVSEALDKAKNAIKGKPVNPNKVTKDLGDSFSDMSP